MIDGLDRIDYGLLALLQNDGRLSNKELAGRIGLAPSSCLERVRRLVRGKLIRGVHADVDPLAMGIGLEAMVAVQLRRHSRSAALGFKRHLQTLAEVVALFNVTGADDFLVHLVVRDAQHLYDLTLDHLATRPEVDHIRTSLIFDSVQRRALPDLTRDVTSTRPPPPRARRDRSGPGRTRRPRHREAIASSDLVRRRHRNAK